MKITIVYDNETANKRLTADWGFSALIEDAKAAPVLFDTGADSTILLQNMEQLGIDAQNIGKIVISHVHGDHTGGLKEILEINKTAEIVAPKSCLLTIPGRKIVTITGPAQVSEHIFSTGELNNIEQSLAIETEKGILVMVGCSHPGVAKIIDASSQFGKVFGIIGGFHGFEDFERLNGLSMIVPCHCTQFKIELLELFPQKSMKCGVGMVIDL